MTEKLSFVRQIFLASFSLNLGLTIVAFFYIVHPESVTSILLRMDHAITRSLHSAPTGTFTVGYFSFFLPSVAIAICLWAIFHRRFQGTFARSMPGIVVMSVAMLAMPIFWICGEYVAYHQTGWHMFRAPQLYEVFAASATLWLAFISVRSSWLMLLLVASHWIFWLWQFNTFRPFQSFTARGSLPFLPIFGLISSSCCFYYLRLVRQSEVTHRAAKG